VSQIKLFLNISFHLNCDKIGSFKTLNSFDNFCSSKKRMDLFVIKDFLQLLRSNLRILDFVVNIMYQFMQREVRKHSPAMTFN